MAPKACFIVVALALAAPGAFAHDYKAGAIEINHPWARATPRGATVAAGYFKLTNTAAAPDPPVLGTSEDAGEAETPEKEMVDGQRRLGALNRGHEDQRAHS